MGELVFVLGGARSGKSSFAERLAGRAKRVAYIATAVADDDEMRRRIALHRKRRPKTWTTHEAPAGLAAVIRNAAKTADFLIVDCITLYLSGLLVADRRHRTILDEIESVCRAARRSPATVVMVSNEVGMGIVPDTPLGREFRDLQGRANQIIARAAHAVYFVIAGIPQKLK